MGTNTFKEDLSLKNSIVLLYLTVGTSQPHVIFLSFNFMKVVILCKEERKWKKYQCWCLACIFPW